MSKKLLGLLVAGLLLFGFAGQSMAAFQDFQLIRVVHKQDGTIEVGTELGNVNTLAGGTNVTVGGGAGAFTNFTTGSISNYYVTYFAKSNVSSIYSAWVSGTATPTAASFVGGVWNGANDNLYSYYNGLAATGGTVVGDGAETRSFWKQIDKSGGSNIGSFAGILTSYTGSEVSLAGLGSGYVDQYLYFIDDTDFPGTITEVAVIRTMADGSTIINPGGVVPIPPSVLLLGSGLLGLIGIRRRSS